jgi:hypothetical protein
MLNSPPRFPGNPPSEVEDLRRRSACGVPKIQRMFKKGAVCERYLDVHLPCHVSSLKRACGAGFGVARGNAANFFAKDAVDAI